MEWLKSNIKFGLLIGGVVIATAITFTILRFIRGKDDMIVDLITKLATSEKTVEIQKGLYAKKTAEVDDLKDLVSKLGEENEKLADTIKKGKMEILALNQLVIKWKKAYESAVAATQGEDPPVNPGDPPRKRVDFTGPVGPFLVRGHTLTDPAFAELSIEQLKPLKLTVALTKNRDGTFSSLVTTDDENVETDITVSAVDPTVLKPKWYQRVWLDGGVNVIGEKGGQLGVSYRLDNWSLGASCSYSDSIGCGVTAGYRLFK